MNLNRFYTETKPSKLFLMSALPGAISMFASSLYVIIDGILLGKIAGETAFAALNLAMPFVIINFALADLIGVGSSVLIALSLGKKESEEANNLFTISCLLIVLTGVIIGALLYVTAPYLITLLGASGAFANQATEYLQICALFSPITTIVFAMDNYLRICGKIKTSMFLNIFMSLLSASLEFVLIYFFKMRIRGAAIGINISMTICAFLALIPFIRGKLTLHFVKPHFKTDILKGIIKNGSPNFLNNIAGRLTSILMNILLVYMGGQRAVSIYGILMYADAVIQPLLYGMCDSLQGAVGYNYGAEMYSRVKQIEKYCFGVSALISISGTLLLFLFPTFICSLFVKGMDSAFLQLAVRGMQLFSLTFLTRWFSFATQSYLLAIGKSQAASILSISISLLFPLILAIVLFPFKLDGIWLNSTLTALFAGILSFYLLKQLHKENPNI